MGKKPDMHVLIGTRKGAYILDGDSGRRSWKVRGPYHVGRDVFQVKADPRHPGTVYAAANSGFWGPMLLRSLDWGRHWRELSLPQMPRGKPRKPSYDGTPKWPVVNVWQIAPGREEEPDSLLLGIDPASLWRSDDRGATWQGVNGLNRHPSRPKWNPGAGGMCLHTILRDPENPRRLYAGISAAGLFRSEDDGGHWTPVNRGVRISFLPPPRDREFGQCLHKLAFEPSDPSTLYRQDHDGIFVSHDRGDRWVNMGRSLPHEFGFVVASAPAEPHGAYFVPVDPNGRMMFDGQLQVYRWNDRARSWSTLVPKGKFPGGHGTHREALATDPLDPPGIYLGTTTGRLYWTATGGGAWSEMPYQFPSIHSVTVAASPP